MPDVTVRIPTGRTGLRQAMRVVHIVPSFYPAVYHGGPIYSLYGLCNAMAGLGLELCVLSTDTAGPGSRVVVEEFPALTPAGYPVYACRRVVATSVAPTLLWHMLHLIRWSDVVHVTAVYSFPTIPSLAASRILGKPVVWSPRGAFQRWDGASRPRLKAIWRWLCRTVAPPTIVLHVTSEEEGLESREVFGDFPTAVIANGVEVPEEVSHVDGDGRLRLLYLGRLDRKKGIENLLAAGQILNRSGALPWSLTIAGGGADYSEMLRVKILESGLDQQVRMIGEVAGEAKKKVFEQADIVVVPSHTENFGMVVAEALAHGVPVVASRGTPWRKVEEIGCGLWVHNDPVSLAEAIKNLSAMPLREMGGRGREWMRREFSWHDRAQKMVSLYATLSRQRS